jgi:aryl-alcohol dehydrogenase
MPWNFSGKRVNGEAAVTDEKGEHVNGLFFGQSSMSRVALVHESCAVKVDARSREELVMFASLGVSNELMIVTNVKTVC